MRRLIEGHKNLVKDLESGAIINTDTSAYQVAVKRQRLMENQKLHIDTNTKDINSMKEDISELKTMMKTLVGKLVEDGR
jgi:hypothetical protein